MSDGRFFAEPHVDALMGAMLGLAGELLQVCVRQRRFEAALGTGDGAAAPRVNPSDPMDLTAPLDAQERAWVAQRADALVAAWLEPFRTTVGGASTVGAAGAGTAHRAPGAQGATHAA